MSLLASTTVDLARIQFATTSVYHFLFVRLTLGLPAAVGIAALALAALLAFAGRSGLAFTMTALGTVAAVATLFTGLYPRLISSPNLANSLNVAGAASAHDTLAVMTVVALIVVPVILLYTAWTPPTSGPAAG